MNILKFTHFWIFLVLCIIVTQNGLAQTTAFKDKTNESIYLKAVQLLEKSEFSTIAETASFPDLSFFESFLQEKYTPFDSLKEAWFENQKALIKKDLGLGLVSSVGANEGFGDSENGFVTGTRLRAGVEWDLFKGGFFQRDKKLKQLEKEQDIFHLEKNLQQKERNYPYHYNNLIYAFNKERVLLLEERIWFLEDLISILYQLHHAHDLPYTELIDYKTALNESKVLKTAYERFNSAFEYVMSGNVTNLAAERLPILEVNLDALLSDTTFFQLQDSLVRLKKQAIELQHSTQQDLSLRLSANYNYRSSAIKNQASPSFNATFRMPLKFDKKEQEKALLLEQQMLDEELGFVFFNNAREMMNLYQEYNFKLKQYVEFRHKLARLNEKERLERVLLSDSRLEHAPLQALKIIDNRLAVQVELLDIKQQLYLRLLKMNTESYHVQFANCLIPIDLSSADRKLEGKRFLYLEEQDLSEINATFLIEYLKKNELTRLLLSLQLSTNRYWVNLFKEAGLQLYCEDHVSKPDSKIQKQLFDGFYIAGYEGKEQQFYLNQIVPSVGHLIQRAEKLTSVPTNTFTNRVELEYWISTQSKLTNSPLLVFTNITHLIQLDQKNLGLNHEKF